MTLKNHLVFPGKNKQLKPTGNGQISSPIIILLALQKVKKKKNLSCKTVKMKPVKKEKMRHQTRGRNHQEKDRDST